MQNILQIIKDRYCKDKTLSSRWMGTHRERSDEGFDIIFTRGFLVQYALTFYTAREEQVPSIVYDNVDPDSIIPHLRFSEHNELLYKFYGGDLLKLQKLLAEYIIAKGVSRDKYLYIALILRRDCAPLIEAFLFNPLCLSVAETTPFLRGTLQVRHLIEHLRQSDSSYITPEEN